MQRRAALMACRRCAEADRSGSRATNGHAPCNVRTETTESAAEHSAVGPAGGEAAGRRKEPDSARVVDCRAVFVQRIIVITHWMGVAHHHHRQRAQIADVERRNLRAQCLFVCALSCIRSRCTGSSHRVQQTETSATRWRVVFRIDVPVGSLARVGGRYARVLARMHGASHAAHSAAWEMRGNQRG